MSRKGNTLIIIKNNYDDLFFYNIHKMNKKLLLINCFCNLCNIIRPVHCVKMYAGNTI